jgi:hypothetical protein
MKRGLGFRLLAGIGCLVTIEIIGLLGLVFLYLFVSPEIPVWSLLPHPSFSRIAAATEFDPNLGWYPPAYMFGRPRNELPPKKPGEVRVFLLGGSTVWGIGATREDETIAKRLEVYLSSEEAKVLLGGTVHVYNEGVPAYYSKQELILLITKIIPFQQPDLVIVLDGLNDFVVYSIDRPHIDRLYSDVWHWNEVQITQSIERVRSPVGAVTNAIKWTMAGIMRNTFFGNFLDQVVRFHSRFGLTDRLFMANGPAAPAPGRSISEQAKKYYLENIIMMKDICESAKARFFWFPQPVFFLKQTRTPEEETPYNARGEQFWNSLREFYETTIGHDARVRFGKAPFFKDISDSLMLFQGTAYVDPYHYSPAAQDTIARRMAEAILNLP